MHLGGALADEPGRLEVRADRGGDPRGRPLAREVGQRCRGKRDLPLGLGKRQRPLVAAGHVIQLRGVVNVRHVSRHWARLVLTLASKPGVSPWQGDTT